MSEEILGLNDLLAKQSAVNASGHLRQGLIEGVHFRAARPVPHEDGHVTEVARSTWDCLRNPLVQVHITTTFAGRVRAWGLHSLTTDRLFIVSGLIKIVVFDGRKDSHTFGKLNEFTVSEKNPGLLVIPPKLYHGWKNIGTSEAVIINMPDRLYDYETPDALDMPWDSELARKLIPFRW